MYSKHPWLSLINWLLNFYPYIWPSAFKSFQRKLRVKLLIWLTGYLLQKQNHVSKDCGSLRALVLIQIKHWVFGQITEFLSSVFNFKEWTLFHTLNLRIDLLLETLLCIDKCWPQVQKGYQELWCSWGNQRWSCGMTDFNSQFTCCYKAFQCCTVEKLVFAQRQNNSKGRIILELRRLVFLSRVGNGIPLDRTFRGCIWIKTYAVTGVKIVKITCQGICAF